MPQRKFEKKNKASENIVNVVYLACLIFGGKLIFQQVGMDLNNVFQDAPIFLYPFHLAMYLIW